MLKDVGSASPAAKARITYRGALAKDAADQAEVFYHAVMQGAASHYSTAERAAWASALPREESAWAARQAIYTGLVAICDGRCVGFLELDEQAGAVITLYVWPSLSGRGIASTLLIHAERLLVEQGHDRMEVEASRVLYDRLLRRGFEDLGEQWVERGGERLQRFAMVKRLRAIET